MSTNFEDLIGRGTTANKPVAEIPGRLYYDTTLGRLERDTGLAWEVCEPSSASLSLDDLIDVNAPSPSNGEVLTWDGGTSEWIPATPSGGGASTLDSLTDVNVPSPNDNDVLSWDSGTSRWIAVAPSGGGATSLDDLIDVNAPTPDDGDSLVWDSGTSMWIPFAVSGSSGVLALDDLTDVNAPSPSDGDSLVWDSGTNRWIPVAVSGGGGSVDHNYYGRLASFIEPEALEVVQTGTFSYVVASNETKYLMASYNTRLGSAGRMEVREPRGLVLPLRGVTLTGLASDASAVVLDPSLATYTNARETYLDRMELLYTLQSKYVGWSGQTYTHFLPGPYGSIILQLTNFNGAWVAGHYLAHTYNLANEINDIDVVRLGNTMLFPVSKKTMNGLLSWVGGSFGVVFVNLPSTWGVITDPLTYSFRDDFTGSTLDTSTVWTRAQGTAGNIEIGSNFAWCKVKGAGSGAWGSDGAYTQSSYARSTQPYFVADFSMDYAGLGSYGFMLGWSDGGGHSYTNFAHGILVQTTGQLKAYENGNDRGNVGTPITLGAIYRLRIRALSGGGATYEIQGGSFGEFGSASWTSITPGTTTSATNTLHAGLSASGSGENYVGDVKVYV